MKHTTGPWVRFPQKDAGPSDYAIVNSTWSEIVVRVEAGNNISRAQGEANARLIAAAPELLEALKSSKTFLEIFLEDCRESDARLADREGYSEGYASLHTQNVEESLTAVRAAISKAESLPKESQ